MRAIGLSKYKQRHGMCACTVWLIIMETLYHVVFVMVETLYPMHYPPGSH